MKTILSITLSLLILHLQATIHTVIQDGTGDYTSIQEAFNNANPNDTILVFPGIYYEELSFVNKGVYLSSQYMMTGDSIYLHNTILDGNNEHRIMFITNAYYGGKMTVDGFTVQHAYHFEPEGGGGAIYIDHRDSTYIRNCIIKNNYAYGNAALKFTNSEEVECVNLLITDNFATAGILGAYFNTRLYLSNVIIRNNYAYYASGLSCGYLTYLTFDPVNRCSIYNNYSCLGSDIFQGNSSPVYQNIIVDTLSVFNPDNSFACSVDPDGTSNNLINVDVQHAVIEPVNSDVYVNPLTGSNNNSGLSTADALKTIAYAYRIIASDSLHPNTIHLAPGTYSNSLSGEFFPIPMRAYVSLIGDSMDMPVLDLEDQTYFTKSYAPNRDIILKNLKIINLNGMVAPNNNSLESIKFSANKNISFENLIIEDSKNGTHSTIGIFGTPNFQANRLFMNNTECSRAITIIPHNETFYSSGSIKNSIIKNSIPYDFNSTTNLATGAALNIMSSSYYPNWCFVDVINVQMTNNIGGINPNSGSLEKSCFMSDGKAKINMINTTIADNGFTGVLSGTVSALLIDDGAEVELYNSILYGDTINEILIT